MRASKFLLVVIMAALAASSCHQLDFANKDLFYCDGQVSLTVRLTRVRYVKVGGNQEAVSVYGYVLLKNISTGVVNYNLGDYQLVLDGKYMSSKPYIDSVASVLVADKDLGPGLSVERRMYWVFTGPFAAELNRDSKFDLRRTP